MTKDALDDGSGKASSLLQCGHPSPSPAASRACSAWVRRYRASTARRSPLNCLAVTTRTGSNLNIHLHCLVLDGVCRCGADSVPAFVGAGGCVMRTELLRDSFQEPLVPARQMQRQQQQQLLLQIREKAAMLDAGAFMALVRGR